MGRKAKDSLKNLRPERVAIFVQWLKEFPQKDIIFKLFLFIFFFASMAPFLKCGYFSDDSLNSQAWITADRMGMSVIQYALKINANWMNGVGRFYPLGWIFGYSFYGLFHPLWVARLAHVCIVGLNIFLCSHLVQKWTRRKEMGFLFIPIIVALFQARYFHDPITGFAPFMQMLLFYWIGAVYLLWLNLETDKKRFLIGSVILFGFGLLTYEITLTLLSLFVLLPLILKKDIKLTLKKSVPYFIVAFAYISFVLYLRSKRGTSYAGTELSINYKEMVLTYRNQLFSALPLSYFWTQSQLTYMAVRNWGISSILAKISTYGGALLFYFGLRRVSYGKKGIIPPQALLLGLGLALLPPILIAVSQRWQGEIQPGVGYVPVYLSYFGVALLMTFLLSFLFQRWSLPRFYWDTEVMRWVLTFGIGYVLFMNYSVNSTVIEGQNLTYKFPRVPLEKAYERGIADGILENSIFLTSQTPSWNTPDLSKKTYKRVQSIQSVSDFQKDLKQQDDKVPLYYLDFGFELKNPEHPGWVFLSRVIPIQDFPTRYRQKHGRGHGGEMEYLFSHPRVYVEGENGTSLPLLMQCQNQKSDRVVKELPRNSKKGESPLIDLSDFTCGLKNFKIFIPTES